MNRTKTLIVTALFAIVAPSILNATTAEHHVITNKNDVSASIKILPQEEIVKLFGEFESYDDSYKKYFAFELEIQNNSDKPIFLAKDNIFEKANENLVSEDLIAFYDSLLKWKKIKLGGISAVSSLATLVPSGMFLMHLFSSPIFARLFGRFWFLGLVPLGGLAVAGMGLTASVATYSFLKLRSTKAYVKKKKNALQTSFFYHKDNPAEVFFYENPNTEETEETEETDETKGEIGLPSIPNEPEEAIVEEYEIPADHVFKQILFVKRDKVYPDVVVTPTPKIAFLEK